MYNKEFLKTLTIMYVDDNEGIRETLAPVLIKIFKEVLVCEDGQDGLDKFKLHTQELHQDIDAIITDINMPKKNGLEMLAEIRKLDDEIPAILTTAHGESHFLMDAFSMHVAYYALKPINTHSLIQNIQKLCLLKHNQQLVLKKEKELSSYISIINQAAIVAKTNTNGDFIEVNDYLSILTSYTNEELLSKNIKDLTHEDTLSNSYVQLFTNMNNEEEWTGLYKGIDKNNEVFYLKLSIIPEFDDNSNELNCFTFIGFVTTDEERIKQDTINKVRQNILDQKRKESTLLGKIKTLEAQHSFLQANQYLNLDAKILAENLDKYKTKNSQLLTQVKFYEKEIYDLKNKLEHIANTENNKRVEILDKYKALQAENQTLTDNLIRTKNQLIKAEKKLQNNT